MSRETGAHGMNNGHDDRLEKDRERRQSDPEYRAWRYNNDLNHVEAIYEFVDRKVAEAVAARDAEIREALHTVDWGGIAIDALIADEYGGNYDDLLRQVTDAIWEEQEAALSHIGLHGDETGGQG